VDRAISLLVDQAYQTARDILLERKEKLVSISEHLINVETIDGEELDQLLSERPDEEADDQQAIPLTLDALAQ